jgi:hypothetical protein
VGKDAYEGIRKRFNERKIRISITRDFKTIKIIG